ncbi:hypothetical protein [Chroococcidiopsis sp. SAG 2025]|uniref:hypothetical protein n=1 Tax=Chroococcidiopsis sp. SAG 2025 TaxID=171389 RepID=UPI002936E78A|nr:hypothetical protein [Chroococcidiopsis sp. SAG 2025]
MCCSKSESKTPRRPVSHGRRSLPSMFLGYCDRARLKRWLQVWERTPLASQGEDSRWRSPNWGLLMGITSAATVISTAGSGVCSDSGGGESIVKRGAEDFSPQEKMVMH